MRGRSPRGPRSADGSESLHCTGCSRSRLSERQEVDVVGKYLLLYEVNPGMHVVARQKTQFNAGLLFKFYFIFPPKIIYSKSGRLYSKCIFRSTIVIDFFFAFIYLFFFLNYF